jgi:hypothetical protein
VREQGWGGMVTDPYGLNCIAPIESADKISVGINMPCSGLTRDHVAEVVMSLNEQFPGLQSFLTPIRTMLVRGGDLSEIRDEIQFFNYLGEDTQVPICMSVDVGAITNEEDLGSILSIMRPAEWVNPGITYMRHDSKSAYKSLQRVLEIVHNSSTKEAFFFGNVPQKIETLSAILHAGFTKVAITLPVAQWLLRVPFNE